MPRTRKKQTNKPNLPEEQNQLESLKKITDLIYLACSEEKLLSLIQHTLPQLCKVDGIELSPHARKKSKYSYSFCFTHNDNNYFFYFHKTGNGILNAQKPFLRKTGQALQKAVIRLENQKQLKTSKEQWELAFDTISEPICLTDLKGSILRTNKTFREYSKKSKAELLQKNYFSAFFGRPHPAENTPHSAENTPHPAKNTPHPAKNTPHSADNAPHPQAHKQKRRETLKTPQGNRFFEISLQKVKQTTAEHDIQLVILRDITEQTKMENKIVESAKSAEIGIISASLAHELNNPIAGIQALLQTLRLQHQEEKTPLNEDIKEMSLAIQTCSNIINRLLNIHR